MRAPAPAPALTLALALALALTPALALAQSRPRVAVPTFSGPGNVGVHRSVAAAIAADDRVELVEGSADIVIEGSITGRARRRSLALTAHDASGQELGSERARVANERAIAGAVRALLDEALARIPATTPETTPRPRPVQTHPAGEPDHPHAETEPPPSSSPAFGADPALLVIAAGAGLRSRETSVEVAGGMTRSYHASPYTELYARIEARPLAHDASYWRGLYLWGEIGYAVGLGSQLPDHTPVSTTFLRMGVHAGYLVPIERILELGAGFGFGWERYDLGSNTVLPAIDYPYLRPAIRARLRVVDELFVIGAEVGYRALLSRGGLSDAFGASGDSFGYDLGATISGATDFGLFYGIEAGWAQFVHAFGGMAGTIAQGTSGSDGGYRLMATLGYALR